MTDNQIYYLSLCDPSEREIVTKIFFAWLENSGHGADTLPIVMGNFHLSCVICRGVVTCDPKHDTCEQRMVFHLSQCLMKWWTEQ